MSRTRAEPYRTARLASRETRGSIRPDGPSRRRPSRRRTGNTRRAAREVVRAARAAVPVVLAGIVALRGVGVVEWSGLIVRRVRRVARECRGGEIGSAAAFVAFVAASVAAAFYAVKRFVAEVVPERRARASPASSPVPAAAPPARTSSASSAGSAGSAGRLFRPPNSREDDEESREESREEKPGSWWRKSSRPPRDRPLAWESYASRGLASYPREGARARPRPSRSRPSRVPSLKDPSSPGGLSSLPPEPPPPLPRLSEMRHPPAAWARTDRDRACAGDGDQAARLARALDVRHATRPYPCARGSQRASIVRDARE